MATRGKNKYVPTIVIEELEDIMREENIQGSKAQTEAFNKMVKYTRVGREVKRISALDFRDLWWRKK